MLTFTDRAREMVLAFMDQSGEELRALRVHMDGSPVAPSFALTLVGDEERRAEDLELDGGGFVVVVDRQSADRLDGATVDFVNRVNGSGFEVIPAEPTGGQTPRTAPAGDLAEKVRMLLEEQVNPSIAAHGGRIELVDVQGTEIYMEMTGGCQGCAMSRVTLRQGVEKMIRQNIPEVTVIHDATDHTAGENPFFRG